MTERIAIYVPLHLAEDYRAQGWRIVFMTGSSHAKWSVLAILDDWQ